MATGIGCVLCVNRFGLVFVPVVFMNNANKNRNTLSTAISILESNYYGKDNGKMVAHIKKLHARIGRDRYFFDKWSALARNDIRPDDEDSIREYRADIRGKVQLRLYLRILLRNSRGGTSRNLPRLADGIHRVKLCTRYYGRVILRILHSL